MASALRHVLESINHVYLACALGAVVLGLSASATGSDLIEYSLCDVRVLYVFDDAETIDWPTLYYLNDNFGCRIDLLSVKPRAVFGRSAREVEGKEIFLHESYLPENDPAWIDSLITDLFQERRPDIVLLDGSRQNMLFSAVREYIINLGPASSRLFNILKIYERASAPEDATGGVSQVVLNSNELLTRYRERMGNEIPTLLPGYGPQSLKAERLVRYRLLKNSIEQQTTHADFLSGISPIRLADFFAKLLEESPKRQTLLRQAKEYISNLRASQQAIGKTKVDFVVDGYRELLYLTEHTSFGSALDSFEDFRSYVNNLLTRAEKAALKAVGLTWEGKIILRDSPHGPKLKFLASLFADGPKEMELSAVRFHPYWDTSAIVLDSVPKRVMPHQAYLREFLIDVDRSYLEAERPESLLFTAEIVYGKVPLVVSRSLPIWEAPDLQVKFAPDYYFVQPFAQLEVDRVVSSMNLRVIITKPRYYSGTVRLNLETPRGLFAGAYRQEIQLDKGSTHETVRIPFSISNLFELGIQRLTAALSVNEKAVAADTGRVRIASCHIADTIKVGFMPDSSGMLEDVLRMTDASFRPLTDRTLMTADLDAYNVIIVGSGSFRHRPSLRKVKDRLQDYLRYGGSIVVMGQPDDWPEGVLPVSLVPMVELVDRTEIATSIPEARILSKPYDISENNLLASFHKKRKVTSAVVLPAEKVYICPSGSALLSISRLGEGQIIYCGFPLLEMISRLEIDAIHLFANILNY